MFETDIKTNYLESLERKGDEAIVTDIVDEMRIKMPAVRIAQGKGKKKCCCPPPRGRFCPRGGAGGGFFVYNERKREEEREKGANR